MWRAISRAVLVVSVALLAGCGGDGTGGMDDSAGWRTSTDPVDPAGLIWASGETVHFPDGSTLKAGAEIAQFAVAGDGIFFLKEVGKDRGNDIRKAPLLYGSDDAEPVDTGLKVDGDLWATSPDGTHLAAIVMNEEDTRATVVIFDLASGDVVRSTDGMDPGDDPEYEFAEAELSVLGIDDDLLYAGSLEGDFAWDLSTGEGHGVEPLPVRERALSPDGTWTVKSGKDHRSARVVSTSGDEVQLKVPEDGQSYLSRWADASTLVGFLVEGDPGAYLQPEDITRLLTCVVPSGECRVIAGVPDGPVLLPMRGDTGGAFPIQTGTPDGSPE